MNTLILLSENKEFSYYAVQVPMGASYGLINEDYLKQKYFFWRTHSLYEYIPVPQDPELLGVYGEILEKTLREIYPTPEYGEFFLRRKGIDLTKNLVAIIKTRN